MGGLSARLRAAADALGETSAVEAGWLRSAAELIGRDEEERRRARASAIWLEELAPEARARKTSLLSAWVAAAKALRAAIHVHESERGPLVEALFPVWRGPGLRRHADQALTAETELRRRLASSYVVRRLAEPPTAAALGPALEALEAAGVAWGAERDRPALAGEDADETRTRLLALADRTTHLLERVRWIVRAALAGRPDLVETVFRRRSRPAEVTAEQAAGEENADAAVAASTEGETTGAAREHGESDVPAAHPDTAAAEGTGSLVTPVARPSSKPTSSGGKAPQRSRSGGAKRPAPSRPNPPIARAPTSSARGRSHPAVAPAGPPERPPPPGTAGKSRRRS